MKTPPPETLRPKANLGGVKKGASFLCKVLVRARQACAQGCRVRHQTSDSEGCEIRCATLLRYATELWKYVTSFTPAIDVESKLADDARVGVFASVDNTAEESQAAAALGP